MFGKVFSLEGFLWRALNTLTDIFGLSTLWLLCSLPVITAGPATTALYDAVVHCVRYKEEGPFRRFFRTFRNELGCGILSTLLWGALITAGVISLSFLSAAAENAAWAKGAYMAYYVLMLLPAGAACWVFPILSRFSYRFGALNLTALKFSVACLPRTFVIVLIALEVIQFSVNYIFPAFFMPACMALLWSLFIEPVFTRFGGGLKKPDAPEEDKEET